jgi:hypothetical protein
MNKRLFYPAMLVLVFGMLVVGCDDPTNNEDTWSDITSLSQMNGTWKGFYAQNNIPIKDVMEEQGVTLEAKMQNMIGDMRVSSRADMTLTINAGAKTRAMTITSTLAFSGGNISIIWPLLRTSLADLQEEGVTVTFNDASHSMIITYNQPAEPLSDEEITDMLSSGLQINQNGTKIKVPADSLQQGTPEIIFSKQ